LTRIRKVSAHIATTVAEIAYRRVLAQAPRPDNLETYIRSLMFDPSYESYV
jgi:malate dehydrogenase (oxaloacetate-decarboxylating)(NADP+)